MSFETITTKLLDSMKREIKREEHMNTINNEIIKPIVDKVLEQLYPYFIGVIIGYCIYSDICFCYLVFKFKNMLFLTSSLVYFLIFLLDLRFLVLRLRPLRLLVLRLRFLVFFPPAIL